MGNERRKNRKGKGKGKKGASLSGIEAVTQHPAVKSILEGGLVLLTAIAGGGAGAALGKHSLIAGVPVALFGIYKNNKYLTALGIGLTISNGFQKATSPGATTQEVEGFDLKQITEQAKERVGTFFKNFSEKLYINSKPDMQTAGLGEGSQEERVSYFTNPYSPKEIDMSAIDRVQEEIAEMNRGTSGMSDIGETEREF
jgi:hypothetical protein